MVVLGVQPRRCRFAEVESRALLEPQADAVNANREQGGGGRNAAAARVWSGQPSKDDPLLKVSAVVRRFAGKSANNAEYRAAFSCRVRPTMGVVEVRMTAA